MPDTEEVVSLEPMNPGQGPGTCRVAPGGGLLPGAPNALSPDQAIEKAARVLADKRRQGCRVCMGYPADAPASEHPLKPDKRRAADVPEHHIAAHIKLARGDVKTVAPILWAARIDGYRDPQGKAGSLDG